MITAFMDWSTYLLYYKINMLSCQIYSPPTHMFSTVPRGTTQ